jgi:hypothetical protein
MDLTFLANKTRSWPVKHRIIHFFAAVISASAHAAPATPALPNPADAMVILNNIATHFPVLFDLITIVAASIGLVYMGTGLYGLYRISVPQGQWTGRQHTTLGAVVTLTVGSILTAAPYMHRVIGNAIYGATDLASGNAFAFQTTGMSTDQLTVYTSLMNFFAICGYAFFVRGWMVIKAHYENGSTSFWNGFWRLVGGTALIYLPDSIDFFMSLTGVDYIHMVIL